MPSQGQGQGTNTVITPSYFTATFFKTRLELKV